MDIVALNKRVDDARMGVYTDVRSSSDIQAEMNRISRQMMATHAWYNGLMARYQAAWHLDYQELELRKGRWD